MSDEPLPRLDQPLATIDLVLAGPARLADALVEQVQRRKLAVLLLATAALWGVPYAVIASPTAPWSVPVTLLGALLVCLPSLYVFGAYLGLKVTLWQVVALGLITPAVTAVFLFAFGPVLWFFDATTPGGVAAELGIFLFVAAFLAGSIHVHRCTGEFQPLLVAWQFLHWFVSLRLAEHVGLFA